MAIRRHRRDSDPAGEQPQAEAVQAFLLDDPRGALQQDTPKIPMVVRLLVDSVYIIVHVYVINIPPPRSKAFFRDLQR
jgi:hypothetical protein